MGWFRVSIILCSPWSPRKDVFGTDWDEYLPYLFFTYHTEPHHLTGELPFYLLHGNFSRPYFGPYRVLEVHPNELSLQPVNYPSEHSIWATQDRATTNNLSNRIALPAMVEEAMFYKAMSQELTLIVHLFTCICLWLCITCFSVGLSLLYWSLQRLLCI